MAGAEQRKARDSMKKGAFRLERSFLFSIKTMFAPNLHLDNHNPLFLLSVLVRMQPYLPTQPTQTPNNPQ